MTVVGSARRLDLAVPASAPVAELLPDVVALAGEATDGGALPRWVLGRLDGGDLAPGASLAQAGVPDGAVLHLRRVDEPVVGLQGADVVERATTPASARADVVDRLLLASTAAALLVLLAALLLRDGRPGAGFASALCGGAAVVAGLWMSSRAEPGTGATAALVATSAVPLLAVAAYLQASSSAVSPTVSVAAGLGGAGVGAGLAALAVPVVRPAAAAAAGLAAGAVGGVLLSLPLSRPQAAAVTAVVAVLLVPLLPRLVLRASGLRLSDLGRAGRTTPEQLATARTALPWALCADGLLVLAAAVVLVRGGALPQLSLAAVCGLLLVLRSRDRSGGSPPLAVTGQLVVVVAAAGLALRHPGEPGPLLVLAAMTALYVLASVVPRSSVDRPRWAQRRRRLEVAAVVALVPLLAAVLGVFDAVVDLARGVE